MNVSIPLKQLNGIADKLVSTLFTQQEWTGFKMKEDNLGPIIISQKQLVDGGTSFTRRLTQELMDSIEGVFTNELILYSDMWSLIYRPDSESNCFIIKDTSVGDIIHKLRMEKRAEIDLQLEKDGPLLLLGPDITAAIPILVEASFAKKGEAFMSIERIQGVEIRDILRLTSCAFLSRDNKLICGKGDNSSLSIYSNNTKVLTLSIDFDRCMRISYPTDHFLGMFWGMGADGELTFTLKRDGLHIFDTDLKRAVLKIDY